MYGLLNISIELLNLLNRIQRIDFRPTLQKKQRALMWLHIQLFWYRHHAMLR